MRTTILWLLPFILAAATAQAQPYPMPQKLQTASQLAQGYPNSFIEGNSIYSGKKPVAPSLQASEFYPIGWSETGLFAYLQLLPITESGTVHFNLHIYNAETNTAEYSQNMAPMAPHEKTIEKVWQAAKDSITNTLQQYNILPQTEFSLQPFPVRMHYGHLVYLNTTTRFLNRDSLVKEGALEPGQTMGHRPHETTYASDLLKQELTIALSDPARERTLVKRALHPYHLWHERTLGHLQSPHSHHLVVLIAYGQRWSDGGPPAYSHIEVAGAEVE